MRLVIEWVLLPAAGESREGRTRFVAFAAPHLEVDGSESAEQTLASFPAMADWPATLAGASFSVAVDGADPVAAEVISTPDPALWHQMFPATTRVEGFVREHPEELRLATFDAITIVDGILDGYSELAVIEPVLEDPWDESFWQPEVWGIPEPVPDVMDCIVSPVLPALVEEEHIEVIVTGEVDEVAVGPAPEEESVLVPPSIVDHFQMIVPAVQQQLDESVLWSTNDEATFVAANSELFLEPEMFETTEGAPTFEELEASTQWQRFAAFNRVASIWAEPEAAVAADLPTESPEELARSHYDFHRMVAALGEHPAVLRELGLIVDLECAITVGDAREIRVVVADRGDVTHASSRTQVVTTPRGLVTRRRSGDPDELTGMDRCRVEQFDFESAGRTLFELAAAELAGNAPAGVAPPLRTAGLRLLQRGSSAALTSLAETHAAMTGVGEEGGALFAEDVSRGARIDVLDETTGSWASLHSRRATYAVHGEPVIETEDEGLIHVTMVSRPSAVGVPDGAVVGISDAIASWDGWSLAAPRPGKAVASDPVVSDPEHRARTGATMAVEVENTALTSCGLSIHTVATPGTLPRLRFGRSYRMRMRSVDLAGQSVGLDAADGLTGAGTVTDPVVFRRFEPVPPPEITWVSTFPPEDPCGETERRIVVRSGLDPDEQVLGEQPWSSERLLLPPACAVTMAEWHGLFDSAIGRGADAAARRAAYEHAATESGSVRPGVDTTPYLADPASGGVTLWDLPGLPAGEVMTVPWHLDVDGRPQPLVLRLEGIEAGQIRMPEVDPSERFITVFLPAGQRAAIRAASIVATPDVMALPHLWDTRGSQAEDAGALLAAGRHPQVSPSITIEAVHAVPRPLSVPVAAPGEPVGPRAEGDSGVQITRPWRVDTATTASVTLRADWTRPRDDLAAPARTVPVRPTDPQFVPFTESFSAPVGGVARVPLGADPATVVVIGAVDDPAVPARLDLGFTGHVPLRIRAHATSRFTDFFPASFREPRGDLPDHFTVASEWEQIAVRNTERPPPPVVTGVLPLLVHRHDGDTRVREGGWVRVWFARPWFVTGAGEWPAIIAVGDGQPWDNRDPRYKYASLIGADLARVEFPETNETPDPHTAASIYGGWPAAWMVFNSVHLAGVEPAERFDPSALHLCDRGFDYDPTRDEWFMDVQVDTPHVAYPFLRLALVRDQPASIDDVAGFSGIRASEVVTPDPITLLPRREMTCTEGVSGVTVSMTGLIAPQFADVDGRAAWGHSVTVTLQRRRGDGDPLLSWEDLRGAQLPLDSPPGAGLRTGFTFRGSLTLPYDPTSPPGEFRLLVVERDRTARVVGDYPSDGTAERMVHAETFPISRAVVP